MKKLTSFFLSALIVCSMLLSSVAFEASASSAPQIYKYEEYLNLSSSTTVTSFGAYTDTTSRWSPIINDVKNYSINFGTQPTFDQTEGILKIETNKWQTIDIKPDTTTTDFVGNILSDGIFEVKGSVKLDAGAEFYLYRLKQAQSGSANRVDGFKDYFDVLKNNPDKWYDFSVAVDLDNDKCTIKIVDAADPDAQPVVYEKKYTLNLAIVQFMTDNDAGNSVHLKNLSAAYSTVPISLPSVLDVGKDGIEETEAVVEFKLDNEIKNLSASHIYVMNSSGEKIAATEITNITSDGNNKIVTASLESALKGWTDYTLYIDKSCYDGYVRDDGKPIEDLTYDFCTPASEFDARATRTISSGEVKYSAEIANKTIPELPVTLILVVYDSKGTMISLTNKSIDDCYRADGSSVYVDIEADIEDDQRATLFMINGWSGMGALFGKTW